MEARSGWPSRIAPERCTQFSTHSSEHGKERANPARKCGDGGAREAYLSLNALIRGSCWSASRAYTPWASAWMTLSSAAWERTYAGVFDE